MSQQKLLPFESFYGFCNTPSDAVILIEACIKGTLRAFDGVRGSPIRSGSVIVFCEGKSGRSTRWTDGERWSPSRAFGPFLIYREIESTRVNNEITEGNETNEPIFQGIEAPFNKRTLKPNTRIVNGGLTKRTITMAGSDGNRYRVISYYFREDVYHLFGESEGMLFRQGHPVNPLETPTQSRLLATFSRNAGFVGISNHHEGDQEPRTGSDTCKRMKNDNVTDDEVYLHSPGTPAVDGAASAAEILQHAPNVRDLKRFRSDKEPQVKEEISATRTSFVEPYASFQPQNQQSQTNQRGNRYSLPSMHALQNQIKSGTSSCPEAPSSQTAGNYQAIQYTSGGFIPYKIAGSHAIQRATPFEYNIQQQQYYSQPTLPQQHYSPLSFEQAFHQHGAMQYHSYQPTPNVGYYSQHGFHLLHQTTSQFHPSVTNTQMRYVPVGGNGDVTNRLSQHARGQIQAQKAGPSDRLTPL
ncbi:Gti1/Pac2 family-domain-containing protein [Chytriomyces sp. MP71]|nr:Gti1/Pac2 family-domain-containing protein [Chytriomyces sp. MP71]